MNEIKTKAATHISLVRHGSVHNPENIFYGRLPGFRLSRKGREEVLHTALSLKHQDIGSIYTSPLLRARQTAQEILKFHPCLKLKTSRLISEIFTPFQGESFQVIESRKWDVYTQCPAGFENPMDILSRTQKFFWRVREKNSGKHVVAVTHGDVILFVLLWAKNQEVIPQNKMKFQKFRILKEYPATGSITTFKFKTRDREELPDFDYLNPGNVSMEFE